MAPLPKTEFLAVVSKMSKLPQNFILIYEHSLRGARGARGANFFLAARVFDVPRNALKRPR